MIDAIPEHLRTSTVCGLVRGMTEARDYAPWPLLRDALNDAEATGEELAKAMHAWLYWHPRQAAEVPCPDCNRPAYCESCKDRHRVTVPRPLVEEVECPACWSGMQWPAGREPGGPTPPWEGCSRCSGSGRIHRSVLATCQPLEVVRLTTWPGDEPWHQQSYTVAVGPITFTRLKCPTCDGRGQYTRIGVLGPSRERDRKYRPPERCPDCRGTPPNRWTCEAWPEIVFEMPDERSIYTIEEMMRMDEPRGGIPIR